jgi:hypothetical protein
METARCGASLIVAALSLPTASTAAIITTRIDGNPPSVAALRRSHMRNKVVQDLLLCAKHLFFAAMGPL